MPLSNPIFRQIGAIADRMGVRAFVVGGYVRDWHLHRPCTDIDVVVVGRFGDTEIAGRPTHPETPQCEANEIYNGNYRGASRHSGETGESAYLQKHEGAAGKVGGGSRCDATGHAGRSCNAEETGRPTRPETRRGDAGEDNRCGIDVAQELGRQLKTKVSIFRNFGTAMLRAGDMEVEFVGARKESYRADSRKPIVEDGTLDDDQKRRDFTINAMAWSLNAGDFGTLLDPFGGMNDLENCIIRTPCDPDITFSDDPLRMIRGVRFATQLGFDIHPDTFDAIVRNRERVAIVSKERIVTELNKILLAPVPSIGFRLLDMTGLLPLVFPEVAALKGIDKVGKHAHKDNLAHTLKVVDNIALKSNDLWLMWAALLHDIGKPRTKSYDPCAGWTFHGHEVVGSKMVPAIFRKMKMPLNDKMKFVQKMVFLHMRPIALVESTVTDSAVRRLLFEAGDDIESLMLLCEADITSGIEAKVRRYMRNFELVRQKMREIEEKDRVRNFQPPVSGEIIMRVYGIPPSAVVGDIKAAIKEAILEGEIANDYDQAYALMEKLAAEAGLKKSR